MPTSEQIQTIAGFAGLVMAMAGVAAMVRTASRGIFHHSIPAEDLNCVEREAKRLYEVTKYRR